MTHMNMFRSLFLWLLAIFTTGCGLRLLLGSEASCGHLLLSLLEVAQDTTHLVKCCYLLEMVVHVVKGVAQVGVHHTLLQLCQADHHHVVRDGSALAPTEPLLRLELVVQQLHIIL